MHFPLFNGIASVPFSIGLSYLDQDALVDNENGEYEQWNTDVGMRILPSNTEAGILPNVETSSKVDDVEQDTSNGMNPEELAPEHATEVAVGNNHD